MSPRPLRGATVSKDTIVRGHLHQLSRIRGHLVKQRDAVYRHCGYGALWSAVDAAVKAIDGELAETQKKLEAT